MKTISQEKIKWIRSLQQKKNRTQEHVFFVEGRKMLEEALTHASKRIKLIVTTGKEFVLSAPSEIEVFHCTAKQMSQLSVLSSPSDFFVVLEQSPEILPSSNEKFVLLDGIQDPGNLGTILRTCDWFGIKHIVCSLDTVERYNPKVIQATMGSIFRVNIGYTDLVEYIRTSDKKILGTDMEAHSIYDSSEKLSLVDGLVIGNEGKGISQPVRDFIKNYIAIPRIGFAESLNAAVTTGIVLSYWTRK